MFLQFHCIPGQDLDLFRRKAHRVLFIFIHRPFTETAAFIGLELDGFVRGSGLEYGKILVFGNRVTVRCHDSVHCIGPEAPYCVDEDSVHG